MASKSLSGFGTFQGVFLPSILTIFGVIMYLRLGWVVGNVGIFGAALIITLANSLTFLTGLSISAIATNMRVGSGGAYYMISRSFGAEAGAAVGLPLFFAQALGVSFYLAGFAESLQPMVPFLSPTAISVGSLCLLALLAYLSADLALKAQLLIFLVVAGSLVSFFMGTGPAQGFPLPEVVPPTASFWIVFAIFFPAVTGIEAGVAMSGDLKNPGRALPMGTLAAVLLGYLVYMGIAGFLYTRVPLETLRIDMEIFQKVALVGGLVLLGIWGATLSSALGALMGAPRTLQALAFDRILPGFLARGHGPKNEPRLATVATFLVALAGVLLGDLDAIAPVLSMFFLTSYGFLNLATAFEGIMGNPSWRPTFKAHWLLSLVGAGGCFAAMLMIDAGAAFVAAIACALIYLVTLKRGIGGRWNDMRKGLLLFLARYSIYQLSGYQEDDTKSWRPNLLVLAGSPSSRWYLVSLANAINQGRGFMTVATIVPRAHVRESRLKSIESSLREYLRSRKVPALVEAVIKDDPYEGMQALIRRYGLGPLTPNTVLVGETEDATQFKRFAEILRVAYVLEKNMVVVRKGPDSQETPQKKRKGRIDVWWGGQRNNAGLMLTLAYMIQGSTEWEGCTLRLNSVVTSEEQRERAMEHLTEFLRAGRVQAEPHVLVAEPGADPLKALTQNSVGAELVLLGMRPPAEGETADTYAEYYEGLLRKTQGLPQTALVLAAENIEFNKILL